MTLWIRFLLAIKALSIDNTTSTDFCVHVKILLLDCYYLYTEKQQKKIILKCLTKHLVYWCMENPPFTVLQRDSKRKLGGEKSGNPWPRLTTLYLPASSVNSTLKTQIITIGKYLKIHQCFYYGSLSWLCLRVRSED